MACLSQIAWPKRQIARYCISLTVVRGYTDFRRTESAELQESIPLLGGPLGTRSIATGNVAGKRVRGQESSPRLSSQAASWWLPAGFLVAILAAGITDKYAANRDFIEYWAAGQQLVQHQNPYDLAATLRLERGVGMMENDPQVTFSPPVALGVIGPSWFYQPQNRHDCMDARSDRELVVVRLGRMGFSRASR